MAGGRRSLGRTARRAAGAVGAAGAAEGGARGYSGPPADDSGRYDDFDPAFDDRGREPSDYPHRDERLERVDGGRKGLFGRGGDKRPKVGDTRRGRDEEEVPPWERPLRNEAYPAVRTRSRMGGLSRVLLAAVLLFGAAIAVFFLPQLLINRPSSPGVGVASPTPTTAAVASEPASPTPEPSPTPFTYTVAPKDTLTRIARRFGVTLEQILLANPNITEPNKIAIGDKIVIPSPAPSGAASAAP
jgi:LysM repeat protein